MALGDPDAGDGDFTGAIKDIWEFLYAGGFFMLVIGLCSVFAITVILYKAISLRRENVLPEDTRRALKTAADRNHPQSAEALRHAIADTSSPLGRIASVAASSKLKSREEAREAVQSYARAEVVRLEGGIPAMDVVITIAPLLGLLGTAAGLVGVFGALDGGTDLNQMDATKLAKGIARALSTTIAGIAVAVPTVIAHSYFSKKVESLAVEMEILMGALLNRMHPSAGGKGTPDAMADSERKKDPVNQLADAVAAASAPGTKPDAPRSQVPPQQPGASA